VAIPDLDRATAGDDLVFAEVEACKIGAEAGVKDDRSLDIHHTSPIGRRAVNAPSFVLPSTINDALTFEAHHWPGGSFHPLLNQYHAVRCSFGRDAYDKQPSTTVMFCALRYVLLGEKPEGNTPGE
jgi:hypothetical protein